MNAQGAPGVRLGSDQRAGWELVNGQSGVWLWPSGATHERMMKIVVRNPPSLPGTPTSGGATFDHRSEHRITYAYYDSAGGQRHVMRVMPNRGT
jgi:hypothetical protein